MTKFTSSEEQAFLDDLDKKVWKAADRLRSKLDAACGTAIHDELADRYHLPLAAYDPR